MGELRHALRAFASEGHPPAAIAGLLNDALQRYHPNVIATLCLALLDPATGELELVNCGHIPALIIEDESGASYRGQGGLMLGLPMHDPHVEQLTLHPGSALLMITDGLVEDRSVLLDENAAIGEPGSRNRRSRGILQLPDGAIRPAGGRRRDDRAPLGRPRLGCHLSRPVDRFDCCPSARDHGQDQGSRMVGVVQHLVSDRNQRGAERLMLGRA